MISTLTAFIITIMGSAVHSMWEMAVASLSKAEVKSACKNKLFGACSLAKVMENKDAYISTNTIGISDLTARSGSLGAAIGFHLMNNVFAFMVADVAGFPGSGLALFLFPGDPLPLSPDDGAALVPDLTDSWLIWQMAVDLAVIGVTWLAVRVAIRR